MKMFKRLCAGLLAGMLMVSSAAAADAAVLQDARPAVDSDGQYTVTFENAALINGNEYVLLIAKTNETLPEAGESPDTFEAPAIDATTLTYIDQTTAADGKVTFTDFIPKAVPNSVVLLGGVFNGKTSPIIIGYIDAKGVVVTGTVTVSDNTSATKLSNITFTMTDANGNTITGSVDASGAFTFDAVPEGVYTMTIQKPGYLTAASSVTVSDEEVAAGTVNLLGGDVNGNNEINAFDLFALIGDWSKSAAELNGNYSDVNENGEVNAFDLFVLITNFGKKGQ